MRTPPDDTRRAAHIGREPLRHGTAARLASQTVWRNNNDTHSNQYKHTAQHITRKQKPKPTPRPRGTARGGEEEIGRRESLCASAWGGGWPLLGPGPWALATNSAERFEDFDLDRFRFLLGAARRGQDHDAEHRVVHRRHHALQRLFLTVGRHVASTGQW